MIVVVVSELVVYFFHLSEAPYNVIIMGDIQGGFPVPILPQFNLTLIRQYLPNAITIGLLGFVESIVVAKVYARKNNYLVPAIFPCVANCSLCNSPNSDFRESRHGCPRRRKHFWLILPHLSDLWQSSSFIHRQHVRIQYCNSRNLPTRHSVGMEPLRRCLAS